MLGDHRPKGTGLRGSTPQVDQLERSGQGQLPPGRCCRSPADIRYYICSYPADAATLLAATKSRCSIENGLHWVLDVALTRIAAD